MFRLEKLGESLVEIDANDLCENDEVVMSKTDYVYLLGSYNYAQQLLRDIDYLKDKLHILRVFAECSDDKVRENVAQFVHDLSIDNMPYEQEVVAMLMDYLRDSTNYYDVPQDLLEQFKTQVGVDTDFSDKFFNIVTC